MRGRDNYLLGFDNNLRGMKNIGIISNSDVLGDDNWLVGNRINYNGEGLRMFGTETSPEIRAQWKKLNCWK